MSEIYVKIVKDRWKDVSVIFFEQGKYNTPIMILRDHDFDSLVEDYQKQKKEIMKNEK